MNIRGSIWILIFVCLVILFLVSVGIAINNINPGAVSAREISATPTPTREAPLVIEDCLYGGAYCQALRLIDVETGCVVVLGYNTSIVSGPASVAIDCPFDRGE
jgi:hypothetical protein